MRTADKADIKPFIIMLAVGVFKIVEYFSENVAIWSLSKRIGGVCDFRSLPMYGDTGGVA